MVRIGAVFIAICMVLIAGSLGAALFLQFNVSPVVAATSALGALVVMAFYNTVSGRIRDRRVVDEQIGDLSRGTADMARQVAELNRGIGALETRSERER